VRPTGCATSCPFFCMSVPNDGEMGALSPRQKIVSIGINRRKLCAFESRSKGWLEDGSIADERVKGARKTVAIIRLHKLIRLFLKMILPDYFVKIDHLAPARRRNKLPIGVYGKKMYIICKCNLLRLIGRGRIYDARCLPILDLHRQYEALAASISLLKAHLLPRLTSIEPIFCRGERMGASSFSRRAEREREVRTR
jgi:hypothetical protein